MANYAIKGPRLRSHFCHRLLFKTPTHIYRLPSTLTQSRYANNIKTNYNQITTFQV